MRWLHPFRDHPRAQLPLSLFTGYAAAIGQIPLFLAGHTGWYFYLLTAVGLTAPLGYLNWLRRIKRLD